MPTDVSVVLQQIDEVMGLYRELRQQSQYGDCSDLRSTAGTALRSEYEAGILQPLRQPAKNQGPKNGRIVFISCGQVTEAERQLGSSVSGLVRDLTPYQPYFAQNQSSLEGLTKNILEALSRAVGLIAIMHPRGKVVSLGGHAAHSGLGLDRTRDRNRRVHHASVEEANPRRCLHSC